MIKWPKAVFAPPDELGGILGGGQPGGDAAAQGKSPPPAGEPPAAAPEGLPEQYWDATAKTVKTDDLVKSFVDLHKFKSDFDARMAARPENPDGYKLEFTSEFKLPEGFEGAALNPQEAAVKEWAQLAHDLGASQEVYSRGLEMWARAQMDLKKKERQHWADEAAKWDKELGVKAIERRDAVRALGKSFGLPEELVKEWTLTADGVRGFELLHQKFAGAVPGKTAGQEPPPPQKPDRLFDILHPERKVS